MEEVEEGGGDTRDGSGSGRAAAVAAATRLEESKEAEMGWEPVGLG